MQYPKKKFIVIFFPFFLFRCSCCNLQRNIFCVCVCAQLFGAWFSMSVVIQCFVPSRANTTEKAKKKPEKLHYKVCVRFFLSLASFHVFSASFVRLLFYAVSLVWCAVDFGIAPLQIVALKCKNEQNQREKKHATHTHTRAFQLKCRNLRRKRRNSATILGNFMQHTLNNCTFALELFIIFGVVNRGDKEQRKEKRR